MHAVGRDREQGTRTEDRKLSPTRLTIDPDKRKDQPRGRVDHRVLDATGEEELARQAREDDAEAMRFARRMRRRLGRPEHPSGA